MKKYDTYKDSGIQWIGQVPEHWAITRIKFLANAQENSFADGDWIESPCVTDSGIRYLTSGNIGNGSFKRQGNGYITEETFQKLNCKFAYPGDLVFCRLNQPFGRSCILPNDQDRYVIAVDNVILRTNEDKRYICYITQLERYQNYIGMQANGTAMQRISRTKLGNVYIPLPPLSEQEAIANFLDKKTGEIDKAISLFEQEKLDLLAYRKAIISETVTKGLNPSASMKDSGIQWIGEIPEHWKIKKSSYIFDIIGSGTTPKSDNTAYYIEDGEFWLQTGDLNDGLITNTTKRISSLAFQDYNLQKYPIGSIVIAMYGATIGKLGLLGIPTATNQACCVLYADEKVQSNKYSFYLFSAAKREIINSANGGGQPNISQQIIRDFRLPTPPLSEQQVIAEYLDKKTNDIDAALQHIDTQITDLRAYRTALISEAVTGKIDVR